MKKIIKIIVFVLISFIFINYVDASSTYVQTENISSKYLIDNINFRDTYDRYIYTVTSDKDLFYKNSSSNTILYDDVLGNLFRYGGLLSYDEFKITKNGKDNNYSYLFDTTEYWTYSGDGSTKYVISWHEKTVNKDNDDEKYNVKVTEIIKPTTRINGDGSYIDPWVFKPQYNVIFRSSDPSKGKIKKTLSGEALGVVSKIIASDETSEIYIEAQTGYEYLGNTCGVIVNDIDLRNQVSNKVKVLSVTRDVECMINFGVKSYKINLVPEERCYSEMTKPNLENVYVIVNDAWYSDYSSVNSISKLDNVPSLRNHVFQGYYDVSNYNGSKFKKECEGIKVIDKEGNLGSTSLTKNGVSLYSDNMTLYPCFTPLIYTIKYDSNGGQGSMDFTSCRFDEDCIISENNFRRDGYTFVGWSTSSDSSTVSYNDKHIFEKNTMEDDITLYAVWKINTVTIKYSGAGNKITSTTKNNGITYKWSINSDNLITRNGEVLTTVIKYNDKLSSNGLVNYNNSSYVNMKREHSQFGYDGYVGRVDKEWICRSNECNKKTYDQDKVYQSSDFCDLTYSSCEVILEVNWNFKGVDINGFLDGKEVYYLADYATVDIWKNGKKIENDVSDYYNSSNWDVGDTFKIDDIKLSSNKVYNGIYSGKLEGKIGYDYSSFYPIINTKNNDNSDTLRIYYNTGYDIGGFSTNFSISGKKRYSILEDWNLGWILDNEDILIRRYEPNTSNISLYHYNDSNNFSIGKKLNGKKCYVNSGHEWNTSSDGSGVSLSQSKVYSYDELVTYSIQKDNYKELNLYVNWKCN